MKQNEIMRSMFFASQKKYNREEQNYEEDDPNDDLYLMDELLELYEKNGDPQDD